MSAALQDGFTALPAIFPQEEIGTLRQAIADSIDRVARVMLTPFAASLPPAPSPEEALQGVERRVVPMRSGDVLLLDRFIPHRARPPRGLQGRWPVLMWVKAERRSSSC
jgi:hypothetical protein